MVATDGVNADSLTNQTRDLAIEEQADRRVPPLAIVNIASDNQKVDPESNGLADERSKGVATTVSNALSVTRWRTNDFHGAFGVASNGFRHASKQETLDASLAM